MTEANQDEQRVYEFIFAEIESAPHLEALLLLWNARPARWFVENLTGRLFLEHDTARKILADLTRKEIIRVVSGSPEQYCYESKSEEKDRLIELVDVTYQRQVFRIATMIHSKASSSWDRSIVMWVIGLRGGKLRSNSGSPSGAV